MAARGVRDNFASALMVLATVAAIAAAGVAQYVRGSVRAHRLAGAGETIERLDIVDEDGGIRAFVPGQGAECTLIRYGSKRCPFSLADRDATDRLYEAASDAACITILAAPTAEELDCLEPSGSKRHFHVAATSFETAASLRLVATPSTLILDKDLRVIWSKLGSIDESSLTDGVGALRRLHERR